MTLEKVLLKYEKIALKNNKEPESVKWLIMELSFYTPHQFYMHQKDEMPDSFLTMIDEAVNKYVFENIPVQHILGFSYFYGYKFKVNDNVLIPRRETEELVEEVLSIYDNYFNDQKIDVLDLGTGSGCIAVTLSLEEDQMLIDAADISDAALMVAKENNQILGGHVHFFNSDWFSKVDKKYEMIIANPPYIPNDETVQDIVEKEPKLALFGGTNGIDPYAIILSQAKNFLKEKALIAFEHGYLQAETIKDLITKYLPEAIIFQKKDMQGKDRMTFVGIGGILK